MSQTNVEKATASNTLDATVPGKIPVTELMKQVNRPRIKDRGEYNRQVKEEAKTRKVRVSYVIQKDVDELVNGLSDAMKQLRANVKRLPRNRSRLTAARRHLAAVLREVEAINTTITTPNTSKAPEQKQQQQAEVQQQS